MADREQVAERLLAGSVKRSYDPVVDIDWDAPLDPGKFFLPPRQLSLYGTPLWEAMSHTQRVELSRQEMANVMSVGIWFENILNQSLLRMIFNADPTTRHVQYALTEMGDECRHMVMFGKLIDRAGAGHYPQTAFQNRLSKTFPHFFRGLMLWVAALIGEEIFDSLQRKTMIDPQLQPVVQQVMRIHVTEEARHIRYAREALTRRIRRTGRVERHLVRLSLGLGGPLFADLLTNPQMYARAGLDPREARRQARANPHFRQIGIEGFDRLRIFLEQNDMMGRPARALWKRAGFIA